jgi:hypothetical protein
MPTTDTATRQPGAKFSFLASHGLRSPLSAIRWACGRLRKTSTGALNEEQRELIEEIHANAKILTMVLGSMQLLGKLEDRSYRIKSESLAVCDMITSIAHGMDHPREAQWTIVCPPTLATVTDGPILESIILNLITVCLEAGSDEKQVLVRADDEDGLRITLFSALELPFVHGDDAGKGGEVSHLVGGVPGLMLCLANGMAHFLGGKVELREADEADASMLRTTKIRWPEGRKIYGIRLALDRR